jgi:hypothetical protein
MEINGIIKIANFLRDYVIQITDDGDAVITPKSMIPDCQTIKYINDVELFKINLTNSTIIECKINDDSLKKLKYRSILINIYEKMTTNQILQNTTFNFRLDPNYNINGYKYIKSINMCMQDKCANGTIKEIVNMIKINKFKFCIKIKLLNDEIIHFKL